MKKNNIYYGAQFIDKKDIIAVQNSLRENLITTGKSVLRFEKNIKKYTKAKYAISCNNGTSALHMAFFAINTKPNDVIIMPSVNFVSSYAMASNMKAKIYLTDVCPNSGLMRVEDLIACIKKNNIKKIKAVVNMYIGGGTNQLDIFFKLKKKFNFKLIEDACHALGSTFIKRKVKMKIGSCQYSDICTFSFHPLKSITTGEGGCLTTNNPLFVKKMYYFRSHGILKKSYTNYDIKYFGFNYRLSDINCALGISQLQKLEKFIQKRKIIAKSYISKLQNLKQFITIPDYDSNSAWHLFRIKVKNNKSKLIKYLEKNKIFCQLHYKPLHLYSFYNKNDKFINAEEYYDKTLSLPIHYKLKDKDIKIVVKTIENFFKDKI